MAEGFRIATGYVQIETRVDKDAIRNGARSAGNDFDVEFNRSLGSNRNRTRESGRRASYDFFSGLVASAAQGALDFGYVMVRGIGNAIKRLPPQVVGALGIGLAAGIVTAAPYIASALNGVILGALGMGVVAGGIALAFQDPKVKDGVKGLGSFVLDTLTRSASSFVLPTLDAIETIKREFAGMESILEIMFTQAATYVDPLVRAVMGFVREMLPGITQAIEQMRPVIAVIQENLPRLGQTIGEAFQVMGSQSEGAAAGLEVLFTIIRLMVAVTAGLVALLSKAMEIMKDTGSLAFFEVLKKVLDGNKESYGTWIEATDEAKRAAARHAEAVKDQATKQEILNGSMGEAITLAGSLSEAFDLLNGVALSSAEAESKYEKAIDDARGAIKEKIKEIDRGTEIGRKYDNALREQITSTDKLAQAVYDETYATQGAAAAQSAASRVYQEGRNQLIQTAIQMGMNSTEAIAYADNLMKIPTSWTTNSNFMGDNSDVNGYDGNIRSVPQGWKTNSDFVPDNAGVKKWKETLSGIPRNIFIKAHFDLINDSEVAMALRLGRLREGGWVRGPGGPTDDRVPILASNREYMLRAGAAEALTKEFGPTFLDSLNQYDRGGRPVATMVSGGSEPVAPKAVAMRKFTGASNSGSSTVYNFAPGSIVVDASRIQSIQQLMALVNGLRTTSRQFGIRPQVGMV